MRMIRFLVVFAVAFGAIQAHAEKRIDTIAIEIGAINFIVPFGPGVTLRFSDELKIRATGVDSKYDDPFAVLEQEIARSAGKPLKVEQLIINLSNLCRAGWSGCLADGKFPLPADVIRIGPPPAQEHHLRVYSKVTSRSPELNSAASQLLEQRLKGISPCGPTLNVCRVNLVFEDRAMVSMIGTGPTESSEDYRRLRDRALRYINLFLESGQVR